jgi:hypothetical protein
MEKANEDATVDKTTWGFAGYGMEAVNWMQGKKENKGGQTTLLYDINHHYPCGYILGHRLQIKPMGFNAQGPAEVFDMLKTIDEVRRR